MENQEPAKDQAKEPGKDLAKEPVKEQAKDQAKKQAEKLVEKPYKILTNFPNYLPKNMVGPEPVATKGRKTLQQWLGHPMRLQITDGRILVGTFACTDRNVNILLTGCKSHREPDGQDTQCMGTILVASRNIVSICVGQESKK